MTPYDQDGNYEPPTRLEHHFGYGYVGIGFCERCSGVRSLATHSAIHTENNDGWCVSCVSMELGRRHSEAWEESLQKRASLGDSPEEVERCEFELRLWKALLVEWEEISARIQHSRDEILEHEWGCVACVKFWHPDDQRANHKVTTALDMNGNVVNVHAQCTTHCFCCDNVVIIHDYRRTPETWNAFSRPCVREVYSEGFVCRNCEDKVINDSEYFMCGCGLLCAFDNSARAWGEYYCGRCGDNIGTCDYCDEHIWLDSDDHSCDEREDRRIIHNYDFRPRGGFTYHGYDPNNVYLGFELEVECFEGNLDSDAERVRNVLEIEQNRGYLKYDGSLNHGFEIVSQPHTLAEFQEHFPFEVIKNLQQTGYRSWDTDTCGFHVHVSKSAFGWNNRARIQEGRVEAHALRFLKLIYDNDRYVRRLAGRSSDQWASFDDKRALIPKVKHGRQVNSRYSAVNVSNPDTFEVRVFKGSMRVARILANLEFVHACVEYTRKLSVSPNNNTLQWPFFRKWLTGKPEYANLTTLLGNLPRSRSAESEEN